MHHNGSRKIRAGRWHGLAVVVLGLSLGRAALAADPVRVLVPDFLGERAVGIPDAGSIAARWMRDTVQEAAPLYRVVPEHEWLPRTTVRRVTLTPPLAPATAEALYDLTGARLLAQGNLLRWGERYAVEVRLYELPSGVWRHTEQRWVGSIDDVPGAVAEITRALFADESPPVPLSAAEPPAGDTDATEAVQARASVPSTLTPDGITRVLEKRFPDMVYVPGGPFTMGTNDTAVEPESSESPARHLPPDVRAALLATERPAHTVSVAPFLIDRYEVSNAQYKAFRPDFVFPAGWDDLPVTNISWHDAAAYAEAQGKRLPTEAEWEKAARGEDERRWPWGDAFDPAAVAFGPGPRPVRGAPGGAGAFGALHMADNVQEWTATVFAPYPGNREPNAAYAQQYRVVRGSHWGGNAFLSRATARFCADPGEPAEQPTEPGYQFIGFRCARDVPPMAELRRWRAQAD